MKKNSLIKKIFEHKYIAFIGLLIVGGLGSGVWELLLFPVFSFGTELVLNLSTLGLDSLRNDIYKDSANASADLLIDTKFIEVTMIIVVLFGISFVCSSIINMENHGIGKRAHFLTVYNIILVGILVGFLLSQALKNKYSLGLSQHVDKLEVFIWLCCVGKRHAKIQS